jgi:hypothetical protein
LKCLTSQKYAYGGAVKNSVRIQSRLTTIARSGI